MSKKRSEKKLRCLGMTKQGLPCRAWAMGGSVARFGRPFCHLHAPAEDPKRDRWGLYASHFSVEELGALERLMERAAGDTLGDEIQTVRIMLRRVLGHLAELGKPTTMDLVRLTPLVLTSAQTVARLLRVEQMLSEEGAEEMELALGRALDELSEEWGVEL